VDRDPDLSDRVPLSAPGISLRSGICVAQVRNAGLPCPSETTTTYPSGVQKRLTALSSRERKYSYLDLRPEHRSETRRTWTRKRLRRLGATSCFCETDLYTPQFGNRISTDIEKLFFGRMGTQGGAAVQYWSKFKDPRVDHEAFDHFLAYLCLHKLRAPKGLLQFGSLGELARQERGLDGHAVPPKPVLRRLDRGRMVYPPRLAIAYEIHHLGSPGYDLYPHASRRHRTAGGTAIHPSRSTPATRSFLSERERVPEAPSGKQLVPARRHGARLHQPTDQCEMFVRWEGERDRELAAEAGR
jgi:hypothetical protein